MFFKKQVVKEEPKKVLIIPKERVRELLVLRDEFDKTKGLTAKFDLWSFVASIYPEVLHGNWTLCFPSALSVSVKQGAAED